MINTIKSLDLLYWHKGLLLALVLSCSLAAQQTLIAQTAQKKEDPAAITVPADSTVKERYIIIGASWGNNSSFLGRNQAERLPFISTDLSYISKSGFWLSGMAYHVMNTLNTVDEVDLTAGWAFPVSKRMDAAVYYSKFFFSPESTLLKASTGNAVSGYLGLDWTYIYSRLTSTVTFGGSTDYFLILDNSRYFGKGNILHKSDSLTVEPRFSVIAGTQTFVQTHMSRQPVPDYGPVSGPGRPGGGPGGAPGGGSTTEYSSSTTSFNILNYEVSLPVTYSFKNLSFEVVPRYSIPVNQLEGRTIPSQFFVTTSLYYTFQSKK